jgi:hypothetical protein
MVNSLFRHGAAAVAIVIFLFGSRSLWGADTQIIVSREGRTLVLQPYSPNIIRITMSSEKNQALAAPGYGFVGTPSMTGWTHDQDSNGYDIVHSERMIVRVSPENLPPPYGTRSKPSNGHFAFAMELSDEGDLFGAAGELMRALSLQPSRTGIRYRRAVAYMKLGNHKKAESELRKVFLESPNLIDGHIALGTVLLQQRDLDHAAAEFQKCSDASARKYGRHMIVESMPFRLSMIL